MCKRSSSLSSWKDARPPEFMVVCGAGLGFPLRAWSPVASTPAPSALSRSPLLCGILPCGTLAAPVPLPECTFTSGMVRTSSSLSCSSPCREVRASAFTDFVVMWPFSCPSFPGLGVGTWISSISHSVSFSSASSSLFTCQGQSRTLEPTEAPPRSVTPRPSHNLPQSRGPPFPAHCSHHIPRLPTRRGREGW